MPLPTIYAKAFIQYQSDEGRPQVLVNYYRQAAVFDDDVVEANALAFQIDSDIGVQLKNVLPADCKYLGTTVRINSSGVINEGFDGTESGDGNVAGESLPDYAAVVIRKKTAVGGKRGRGRWFVGCVAEPSQDTGKILPGGVTTDYNGLGDSLRADQVTANGTWQSCHYSRADQTLVLITGIVVVPNLATQRRRRLRGI